MNALAQELKIYYRNNLLQVGTTTIIIVITMIIGTLIDNVPRQLNYSNEFAPAESVPWILY